MCCVLYYNYSSLYIFFSLFTDGIYKKLEVSSLKAKEAIIDTLHAKIDKIIFGSNADIGYHYVLRNPKHKFEEGEIVIIKNQRICKITPEADLSAETEGGFTAVITRRNYVAARKPEDGKDVFTLSQNDLLREPSLLSLK